MKEAFTAIKTVPKPFDPQGEKRRGRFFLFFGVILPVLAMTFELVTHFCAKHFFDPFPSPWHVVLFSLIPLSNLLSWLSTRRDMSAHFGFMSLLSGMAVGIGALYTLMFLPLTPSACMYTLAFGFGLLGLAPMLSLPCSWLTGRSVTRMAHQRGTYFNAHQVEHIGHLIVLVMVVAIELPSTLTRVNLATACGVGEAHAAVDAPPPVPVSAAMPEQVFTEEPAQKPGSSYGCVEPAETVAPTTAVAPAQSVVPVTQFGGLSKEKQGAIDWLRKYGNQETMLRACYERSGKATDILGSLYESGHPISVNEARNVFYLVTGKPYNSVPIPKSFRATVQHAGLMRESDPLNSGIDDEFDRDTDMAGESVAGVARGLSIAETKITGVADPDSALARLTWTFSFKNDSKFDREGRAKILLPKDAVVSRATLTVNGEEREAKVMARSEARAIYRQALIERKDPLLVSYCGRDQVLVQCFPIDGGSVMQVKLQIDAPMTIADDDKGTIVLPAFIERNFVADAPYVVDIASPRPALIDCAESDKSPQPGHYGGIVSAEQMAGFKTIAHFDRDNVLNIWSDAGLSFLNSGSIVERRIGKPSYHGSGRVYFVIDGSIGMAPYFGEIASALEKMPKDSVSHVVLVGDQVECLALSDKASLERIRKYKAVGGHDDLNALTTVLASCEENDRVVWIHGAQPVAADGPEQLRSALSRFPMRSRLFDMPLVAGPNEVLGALDVLQLERVPRAGAVSSDLLSLAEMMKVKEISFAHPSHGTAAVVKQAAAPGSAAVSQPSMAPGCAMAMAVDNYASAKEVVLTAQPVSIVLQRGIPEAEVFDYQVGNLNQGKSLGRKAGAELTNVFAGLAIRNHEQGNHTYQLPVADGQLAESLSIVSPISSAVVTSPDEHETIKAKEVTFEEYLNYQISSISNIFTPTINAIGPSISLQDEYRSANIFEDSKDSAPTRGAEPVYESKQEAGQAYGGAKRYDVDASAIETNSKNDMPFNGPVAAPAPEAPPAERNKVGNEELVAKMSEKPGQYDLKKGQLQGRAGAAGNLDALKEITPRNGESQEQANDRVTRQTLEKLKGGFASDKPDASQPVLQGATNGVVTQNRYSYRSLPVDNLRIHKTNELGIPVFDNAVSSLNNLSSAAGVPEVHGSRHRKGFLDATSPVIIVATLILSLLTWFVCVLINRLYNKDSNKRGQ